MLLLLLMSLVNSIVLEDDLHPDANVNPSEIPWSIVNYDGSDVNANDGTIFHKADWAPECDPWKDGYSGGGIFDRMDAAYDIPYPSYNDESWNCPEDWQSPSGCGDFLEDPRQDECTQEKTLARCSDQRVVKEAQPLVTQFHVCVQHPIHYINDYSTTDDSDTPPMNGRHRERWPLYGEYQYLPKQRWLHAAEHGAVVFLYDPCLSTDQLCQLKQYITSVGEKLQPNLYEDTGAREVADQFRYVLTPYKNLRKPIAIVAWGVSWFSSCMNEPGMDAFINEHYRQAWEDWPPGGAYDYLYMGKTAEHHDNTCPALTEYPWRQDSTKTLYEMNIGNSELFTRVEDLERRMLELAGARRRLRKSKSDLIAKQKTINDLVALVMEHVDDEDVRRRALEMTRD